MIRKIVCGNCGSEIAASDKYCSSCGTAVESIGLPSAPLNCPLCGQKNETAASYCESCGAALRPGAAPGSHQPPEKGSTPSKLPPLKVLQSCKLTLGLAFVPTPTIAIVRTS